jgi:hypothetical protein
MIKLIKLGLIGIAILAIMYLVGSGQITEFINFCSQTLKSL